MNKNMVYTQPRINPKNLTWLPLVEVVKDDSSDWGYLVTTPHKGDVVISVNKLESAGFIFTHTISRDKLFEEFTKELRKLENETYEFLRDKWLKSLLT